MQVLTTTASMSSASSPAARERPRAGLGGERRRVGEEAPVERVGVDREHLVERVEREAARLDAVVALQDTVCGDQVRARVEPREPVGRWKRVPALGLGVAACGVRRSQTIKNIVEFLSRTRSGQDAHLRTADECTQKRGARSHRL